MCNVIIIINYIKSHYITPNQILTRMGMVKTILPGQFWNRYIGHKGIDGSERTNKLGSPPRPLHRHSCLLINKSTNIWLVCQHSCPFEIVSDQSIPITRRRESYFIHKRFNFTGCCTVENRVKYSFHLLNSSLLCMIRLPLMSFMKPLKSLRPHASSFMMQCTVLPHFPLETRWRKYIHKKKIDHAERTS